ncbi:rhomboid family intramembrane serine protease [Candidatus Dojkabacteria bacterium]|uniref:Rhomboid family intramembrane serine protease n=1 Tax=Candidatus Dojkabacteria bacterium TaxID=2099670 RepID=A0A955I9K1_9BACT|nr:rhomboid family intramembrane serine protease [Candidatus Dojkabacteria bacterium]
MFRTERGEYNWLYILISFNFFVFFLYGVLGSTGPVDDVLVYGIFNTIAVEHGYLWLLTTANFLHFEVWHIFFNMVALYQIGTFVQEFYSTKKLFITYIVTGVVSSIGTLIFASVSNENITSLGASGAVFGILGLLVGGTLKNNRYGASLPFSMQSFVPTLFLAVIIAFMPGINWVAHLFGFLSGVFLGFILENNLTSITLEKDRKLEKYLFAFTMFIFVISYFLLIANLLTGFADKL